MSTMINVITSPSCLSCRKVCAWLKNNEIEYIEKNISQETIDIGELMFILSLTENGIEEILSTRSKIYKHLNIDFNNLSFSQTLVLFSQHPQLLRRPIVYDKKRIQVGFNEEDIRVFLPRERRSLEREILYNNHGAFLNRDILIAT